MDRHVWMDSKDSGHLKWRPWPVHERLMGEIQTHRHLLILKARQIGVSWLLAGYATWRAALHTHENVLLLSQGQDEATALLAKCRYIVRFLPDWMRPEAGKDNDSELEFPALFSRISAYPSTQRAGRGEGTTLVVCDEWAHHPYASDNWGALQPTLGTRARFVGVSTANGRGDFFHSMWQGAEAGTNGFRPLFISCYDAPGRDAAWYEQQAIALSATPHLLAQEHPRNAVEAFISSGNCRFDTIAISEALEQCAEPAISLPITAGGAGHMLLWERPATMRRYVIGADVAEGKDAGNATLDSCHAAVLDWETGRHVAGLHGQWESDTYALLLDQVGRSYNRALLAVESNNHGHAVLLELSRHHRYPRLYWHLDPLKAQEGDKLKPDLGWPTNQATKPRLVNELATWISQRQFWSRDRHLWDECLSFVNLGNGQVGAQPGAHDDRVMAHGIALMVRAQPSQRHYGAIEMNPVGVGTDERLKPGGGIR